MLRLVVVGLIAYLGYRQLGSGLSERRLARQSAVAGGPLSERARLQTNPDEPPRVGTLTPAPA